MNDTTLFVALALSQLQRWYMTPKSLGGCIESAHLRLSLPPPGLGESRANIMNVTWDDFDHTQYSSFASAHVVRVWICPQYWNRRPRRPWSEDRSHLGGPKHLIAEEAEGTKQHGGQTKVKEQQEDEKLNSSWKLSVIKVLCEDLQFWLCGRKAYLPPKTTSYCWDAKRNAREYMLAAFSSPLYWKEQQ